MEEGTMQKVVIEWVVTERHKLEMTEDDFRAAFYVSPEHTLDEAVAMVSESIDEMADAEDGDTWQATEERELLSATVKTVE
jgi:hypothetical protein